MGKAQGRKVERSQQNRSDNWVKALLGVLSGKLSDLLEPSSLPMAGNQYHIRYIIAKELRSSERDPELRAWVKALLGR